MRLLRAAIGAALLAFAAAPALADGLIDNVNGLTLDDQGRLVRFDGLLVDGEGKVAKLLARTDKRPEKLDFRLDARGRTLMPGLIDAHAHVMGIGFQALQLDLSAAKSLDEAKAMIAAYAAANPKRPWILGGGWNQEAWGLGRFPTAADIDAVVADRPVWLERVDGHAGWANSAAMAAAGVTARTATPPGGRIGPEKAGAAPAGVFVDAARGLIDRVVPPPLPRDRDLALARAQQILLGQGVTAVADMGTSLDDWMTYRRAGDLGALSIRIIAYAGGIDPLLQIAGPGPTPWLYGDRLRMVGVKLYSDGALGSRGAWLKRPYADAPGQSGLGLLDDAKLRNLMSRAAMDGFQVAVHAIGDAANAQLLAAIEELSETYHGDRRWRIEHAQIVDPADIARFGRHGIVASMQPLHQTSDRLMAEARLGPDRLAGAYAWKSIHAAGAPLAFGSDAPVEPPNPFAGMAAAISREGADGNPFGGWMPAERVSREIALAGYTTAAAFAGMAEDRIGSLTPGHRADFLLLDGDPMEVSPAALRAMTVQESWIAGKRVFVRK
ncbi:amidohydrolase family protein [uncultured Sphingomonas sp.]|uniref:amidohydrolase n=1 Tax=uncultured Sphingomonas sp. TaxID=158754 RepID=UPI0026107641|nr:amidohydrolase family protein [uncultured Sphingomonas sp.]